MPESALPDTSGPARSGAQRRSAGGIITDAIPGRISGPNDSVRWRRRRGRPGGERVDVDLDIVKVSMLYIIRSQSLKGTRQSNIRLQPDGIRPP
jgi:hypothetical protein